jgi:hypothetical protein
MSHLIYFIPGETAAIDRAKIDAAGLAHAFEARIVRGGCATGPDGTGGVLLSAGDDGKVGFFPDRQTWKRFPRGAAWVGFYTDDRPTPADLQTAHALAGHSLELLDGQSWTVPLARQFRDEGETFRFQTALPQTVSLDDEGDWTSGGILPRYMQLWELACQWYDSRTHAEIEEVGETTATVKFEFVRDVLDAAAAALAVNYRLGKVEIALLGLLTVDLAYTVLDLVVDFPVLLEWSKKNPAPPATSNSSAG